MSIGERVKQIIRSVGPGFIVASAALGPGSITVASRIGSVYGYAFLWVIVVAAISMVAYTSMSLRFGISHERSILQQIAVTYGRWFSVVIGICAFLSASSFQFGNNLGIGIAMEGITGVDERVWPFIFTPLGMLLVFRAGNLYKILEKLMMGMVMIMILAFLFNLILARPDMGQVAQGFVPKSFSLGDLDVVAALVATTFVLNGALYQSYLAQDKGWKIADAKKAQNDTYMGISLLAIISALVIITSAAVLNPLGIVVNSAADMALQLESLFGRYAKVIFSFGLCAAAFSSLMVNAVMGGGLLSDGLGLGRSMNEKMPKLFTVVILLVGMLIAVFFKGNVVYALILAQASSILAVPLIAIGILLIVNRKTVMGKLKNGKLQNTLAILGFLLICVMVYFMYAKIISFIRFL
ncbi:Nramp family divalent metal transporter [Sunxiuqinia elliptica]|uniref:NRAMP (Natural resistance-associated macrophage protein)-like metal ion transporter n=1 Tax=Sunxiuqinia elliptica TaxID=655355 RepID=A0A4R6H4V1_9BACT|nr:Nramp family divalent metal transporter [Sunxiuqinia elliptica]TDO03263.1 NRAMP (natural resistance-associated macrophage protein)-like metal ion transporter [Sunxiuqinia elliptica]TDO59460.1 NRAMP (natural resistance-associated macrophage protein)-like metal ion transporter [Sunxiuqinia elliptica]